MLTTVKARLQPQFTMKLLTLVAMPNLQSRLKQAMENGGIESQAALAKAAGVSRVAVSKWLENGKNLKMEHLFKVADVCKVSPRWLATGAGQIKVGAAQPSPYDDIPIRRLDLIRMYGRLPAEVRETIRALIESLAYLQHPSRAEYERRLSATHMVHEK